MLETKMENNMRSFSLRIIALSMMMLFASLNVYAAGKMLQVKGSDTMVNLMSNIAEAYMTAHPGTTVAVTGGGSGTGIAALLNGTTDICAASRSWKKEEIDLAKSKGINPTPTVVGLDGIAVMVNKMNPVSELSIEQLRKIYTGEYTNWKDVGGPDRKLVVLSRESNSGTYVYFQEHVLNKADYAKTALLLSSTAAITKAVTDDASAIGYGGIAYAEHANVKTIMVKNTTDATAVAPSTETVLNGTYPISRPLYLYTNGTPAGDVKTFVDYCMSSAGQKIVTETGYIAAPKQ
jgi:phosphate transport system substrate-binding protein